MQLLPSLYRLSSGGSRGACVGAIQDKLESMAGEVAQVMEEQLQVRTSMMDRTMATSSLKQSLLQHRWYESVN